MNNNYSNNRTPTTAAAAPLTPAPTLQDGVASLSACRGVIAHLDERLQTAAGRLSEARERVLRAREAVSFTSFRLVATRARTSVSLAEVRVLRQIAEVQQKTSTAMTTTNVDKVCSSRGVLWGGVRVFAPVGSGLYLLCSRIRSIIRSPLMMTTFFCSR